MDFIDNIIFTYHYRKLLNNDPIDSDYLPVPKMNTGPFQELPAIPGASIYTYPVPFKLKVCAFEDTSLLEKAVWKHWYDISAKEEYKKGATIVSNFKYSSTYHLIYCYLLENTRLFQIFERVIDKYMHDEELGIAEDKQVFNWIQNTEKLFYKNDYPKATNLRSLIRPSSDESRRNAYFRLFGIDLAFGDLPGQSQPGTNYFKAKANNQQFIPLFEKYLSEIWQGYLNARNTSGPNTTDINVITDLALQLREIMQARRGRSSSVDYAYRNLSREEFSSVLLASWFALAICEDTPIVKFLKCESSTIGERLLKIGDKVGVPAHRKSQALFEMAGAASNILCALEAHTSSLLISPDWVENMLMSMAPVGGSIPPPSVHSYYMNLFLTVINNWEKATGHRIKNPEAAFNGTLRISPSAPKKMIASN